MQVHESEKDAPSGQQACAPYTTYQTPTNSWTPEYHNNGYEATTKLQQISSQSPVSDNYATNYEDYGHHHHHQHQQQQQQQILDNRLGYVQTSPEPYFYPSNPADRCHYTCEVQTNNNNNNNNSLGYTEVVEPYVDYTLVGMLCNEEQPMMQPPPPQNVYVPHH